MRSPASQGVQQELVYYPARALVRQMYSGSLSAREVMEWLLLHHLPGDRLAVYVGAVACVVKSG